MVRPVYLIGRANVGKSTIGHILSDAGLVEHADLDRLLRDQFPNQDLITVAQDWTVVGRLLDELDHQELDQVLLVSLGAGTQDRDRAHGDHHLQMWLRGRRDRVIFP
jgi:hypothetical protein